MRQIKFRCLREGVWHYATLDEIISHLGFDYGVPQNVLAFIEGEHKDQFTGLLDHEGVEIYESDIVKAPANDGIYLVRHGEYHNIMAEEDSDWEYGWNISRHGNSGWPEEWGETISGSNKLLKVIGNIHQNPELLK